MLNHKGTQTIKTERMTLRRFAMDDAPDMYRNWACDPRVTRYVTWNPHGSVEDTVTLMDLWVPRYESERYYNWAMEYEGEVIGNVEAVGISDKSENAELGYCMSANHWNRGLMTEAVSAIRDFLFRDVGIHRLVIRHAADNPASGRVAQKCGCIYEGCQRGAIKHPDGEFFDILCYALLRPEWEALHANVRQEIAYYNRLPCRFDGFADLPVLTDGVIELVCAERRPAIPEKNYVPSYEFNICRNGEVVGHLGLRIGYTDGLYYGGQIGYGVSEGHRGNGYAGRACRLAAKAARLHGMEKLLITNNVTNTASRRVCEKLGARHVRTARLPEWTELYQSGQRYSNIFEYDITDVEPC